MSNTNNKRKRDDSEAAVTDAPPSTGGGPQSLGADGASPIHGIQLNIRQGANGHGIFRANGRTKRMCVSINCSSEEQTQELLSLLEGTNGQGAWMVLDCELKYEDGSTVEMKNHGRHPDVINVMEPSGSQRSAVSMPLSTFLLDSRSSAPMAKKASMQRGEVPLSTSRFVEAKHSEMSSRTVDVEVKISTNVTSRQHDGQNFRWHVTLRYDLGDGCTGELESHCENFQYVARQLKQHSPGKKKILKKKDVDEDTESEETDNDFEEVYVPPVDTIRRSTRKRSAPSYRAHEYAEVAVLPESQGLPESKIDHVVDEAYTSADDQQYVMEEGRVGQVEPPAMPPSQAPPAGKLGTELESPPLIERSSSLDSVSLFRDDSISRFARDCPVPQRAPKLKLQRDLSSNVEEEEILRQPTHLGLNLCRTESVEKMFDNFSPTLLGHLGLHTNDINLTEADDLGDFMPDKCTDKSEKNSKLALSKDNSWSDFFDDLGVVGSTPTQNA